MRRASTTPDGDRLRDNVYQWPDRSSHEGGGRNTRFADAGRCVPLRLGGPNPNRRCPISLSPTIPPEYRTPEPRANGTRPITPTGSPFSGTGAIRTPAPSTRCCHAAVVCRSETVLQMPPTRALHERLPKIEILASRSSWGVSPAQFRAAPTFQPARCIRRPLHEHHAPQPC
jgi:hypothetical protein